MNRPDHPGWVTVPDLVARFVADPDLNSTLDWLTEHCAEVPDTRASALLLADGHGALDVAAASSDLARWLPELESQSHEGPARDSYTTCHRIDGLDLSEADTRWPRYAACARRAGIRSVHAFPLALPGRTIGALTMYFGAPGGLPEDDLEQGQALASTAALGVASCQATQDKARADQLQGALDSRVLIEQAKGLLAERLGITPGEAFGVLRRHARNHQVRLDEVCAAVLDGSLSLSGR
ncbi:ANTAR domain-containing protein [Kribbella sp. NPDC004875]|uniref:ANTAR domain-containing protein n=1 Tax=Kribbella sp. NPDC004875 TaxID=3364107 RepID=UPI0036C7D25A